MDPQSITTLLILAFLILMSAYFSATETAFSALRPSLLKQKGESNQKRLSLTLNIYDNFDRLISTILTGNTIVNLSAASIATAFFIRLYGDIGTTISVIVITVVMLIFAEVTPKTLAMESPERFALFSAPILRFFILFFTPFNLFFGKWRDLLTKLVGDKAEDRAITDDELMTMVEEMEQDGGLDEEDIQLIHNAIEFKDTVAEDILTPRVKIKGVSKDAAKEEIAEMFASSGLSRLAVFEGDIDNITGFVHLRDYFKHTIDGSITFESIITEPVFVAPTLEIPDLVKELQSKKNHIAVVVDEYGGTAGIVTMEDILEELVGEIWDESDDVVEEFILQPDDTYKVMGDADIDRFFAFFDLEDEADKEEIHASTVNGFIMDELGKIPEEGDIFTYKHLHVTVTKTENRKVLDCIVSRITEKEETQDDRG